MDAAKYSIYTFITESVKYVCSFVSSFSFNSKTIFKSYFKTINTYLGSKIDEGPGWCCNSLSREPWTLHKTILRKWEGWSSCKNV